MGFVYLAASPRTAGLIDTVVASMTTAARPDDQVAVNEALDNAGLTMAVDPDGPAATGSTVAGLVVTLLSSHQVTHGRKSSTLVMLPPVRSPACAH